MTAKMIDVRFDDLHSDLFVDNVERPDHYNGVGIVEDEAELVKVLTKLFTKHHVKVCFATDDGLKALEIIKGSMKRPKVLLMDFRLFNLNGVEAMKEIRKVDPDISFVFLSADIDAEKEALKAGAKAFLKKPASTHDIISAVNRALARTAL